MVMSALKLEFAKPPISCSVSGQGRGLGNRCWAACSNSSPRCRPSISIADVGATATNDGSVANFGLRRMLALTGHNYSASSANCAKPESPDRSNCPLRIMCATSMPAKVAAAELNDLNVCMGRVILFMKRWSLDRQVNAQQSPRGVFYNVVEIFHLHNVDQPAPAIHH